MGRYNKFTCEESCPHCAADVVFEFQADVGLLQWRTYSIGNKISGAKANLPKPEQFGPSRELLESGRDFWAYGLAVCPTCTQEVWARLTFRRGIYDSCSLIDPPSDPYAWGISEDGL